MKQRCQTYRTKVDELSIAGVKEERDRERYLLIEKKERKEKRH